MEIRVQPKTVAHPTLPAGPWIVEPFLHIDPAGVYNPLTDQTLLPGDAGYSELVSLVASQASPDANAPIAKFLAEQGWLVRSDGDLDQRFLLKYVSLEATSDCNQACYFCPVSIDPREHAVMPMDLYENIVRQLAAYKDTLQAVFMMHYNEPTLDARLMDRVRMLKTHGLTPVINTNGSGLTRQKVDALVELGGIGLLSINLSTLDRERYRHDRGRDHLPVVLDNLDYAKYRRPANLMEITVLGHGDADHKQTFEQVSERFAGSNFTFRYAEIMDRAGNLDVGLSTNGARTHLAGCRSLGSRPLQHLQITSEGICVMCPQDYYGRHIIGDLKKESVHAILTGPRAAAIRRWTYGLEEAPEDFLCRHCVFARCKETAQ